MESRLKVFGHALHPMLVALPFGLWATAVAFDVIGLVTDDGRYHASALHMITLGVVGALLAGLAGAVDALAIPPATRAKSVAVRHGLGNTVVLAGFVVVMVRRRYVDEFEAWWLVVELALLALAGVTGWLGSELRQRHAIGIPAAAGVDAPRSPLAGEASVEVRLTDDASYAPPVRETPPVAPVPSRAKALGHALHPLLVLLPLGLFPAVVVWDVLFFGTDDGSFADAAYLCLAAGVVTAVVAAVPGIVDWRATPGDSRARGVGRIHALLNGAALVLLAASWLVRFLGDTREPGALAFLLALAGVGVLLAASWFGGELHERLAVGVDAGAYPDAPSSLATPYPDESAAPAGTRQTGARRHR